MDNDYNTFINRLRFTYLQGFVGQYINIEDTSYSEKILGVSLRLTSITGSTYDVVVVFNTQFNTRQFTQTIDSTDYNRPGIENIVQQMVSAVIQPNITHTMVDFCLP